MWPSEDWASKLYDIANWGLIVGLIVGVISTVLLVWMGNVKEGYLRSQLGTTGERAAHAEERAAKVEAGNIQLRTDLETETGKVAVLEKDAANAKAAQQKVEIELAKQREKAAIAERSLLELRERVKSRHLSKEQKEKLRTFLTRFPSEKLKVMVFVGAEDGIPFSMDLIEAINSGGWKAEHVGQTTVGGELRGVAILVKDATHGPKSAAILATALREIGIEAPGVNDPNLEEGDITLFIAPKVL